MMKARESEQAGQASLGDGTATVGKRYLGWRQHESEWNTAGSVAAAQRRSEEGW